MVGRKRADARTRNGNDGLSEVRRCLQSYADRGVFRGFAERPGWRNRKVFRFAWLARRPFDLEYEPESGTFVFVNALPNVTARTPLSRSLKAFVEGRADPALPGHRRIDPERAEVSAFVREGDMRLKVVAEAGHHGYAANRAVNLMHEVYVYLQSHHPDYLWANYDAPQD